MGDESSLLTTPVGKMICIHWTHTNEKDIYPAKLTSFYTYVNLASSKSVSAYVTVSGTMQTNEQHSDLCYDNTWKVAEWMPMLIM